MIVVCRTTSLTSAADKRLGSSSRNLLLVPCTVFCEVWRLFLLYRRDTEWSSLPDHAKDASSLDTFKQAYQLKTYLFIQLYNWEALWESSMETYIHSRIYKFRGSPAWKHTFTQEDIQALGESRINTIGYTSSVGVQHGNTHSHWIYKRPWESSKTPAWKHTFTQENIHIGGDLALTLREGRG